MRQPMILALVLFASGFTFTGCDDAEGEIAQGTVPRSAPQHAQVGFKDLIDNRSEALGAVLRAHGYFPGVTAGEDISHDSEYSFEDRFSNVLEADHRGELWTATLWANVHTHETYPAQDGGTVDIPMPAFIPLTFARQGSEGEWKLLVSDGLLFELTGETGFQSDLPRSLQEDLLAVFPDQRSFEDWYSEQQRVRAEAEVTGR